MASNIFVQIDSQDGGAVQGESVVGDYKDQIEVSSWSWGVSQSGSASSSQGGSTGTANVTDLTFTANVDKSFPILAQMAGKGTHVKDATLTICKTGGTLLPYLVIKMTGGLVSQVAIGGTSSDSGAPTQVMTVALNFAKVEFDYTPQTTAGAGGAAVSGAIDISGNA
jgi:type VI secretion system secreted protein Hcp